MEDLISLISWKPFIYEPAYRSSLTAKSFEAVIREKIIWFKLADDAQVQYIKIWYIALGQAINLPAYTVQTH